MIVNIYICQMLLGFAAPLGHPWVPNAVCLGFGVLALKGLRCVHTL